MAGYSKTPLVKKLGIKPGFTMYVENPPPNYQMLIAPLPEAVTILSHLSANLDFIHFFTKSRPELAASIGHYAAQIQPNGMIWVSWPKKSAKVATDVTEDVIREIILPLGLVDVKVCAIDEVWSGLKLVIRRENRPNLRKAQ
ncbi:MAG: DUF3052 domain-containing protein [Ardenticatenaceae bacterium]|nr:DUF3052 domain-containing protein [Ardenticatenaceae bacterium]